MMRVLILSILGCGGSGLVELPMDKTLVFELHSLEEHLTRINCDGRMYMPQRRVHAACRYSGPDTGMFEAIDTFDAAIEYLPHPEAVWLHFYVVNDDKSHYPVSQGMPMAMHLSPGGKGWLGDAVFYPRDSAFGYMDRPVEAWVEEPRRLQERQVASILAPLPCPSAWDDAVRFYRCAYPKKRER